jgi:chromosome segregation ATPase
MVGFFSWGNLITLSIVALTLILYRQLDRKNRPLERVRKYVDKVMVDLDAYAEEKGAAVKDFGIALEVERKSAAELMKRLQALTEQELAEKAAALSNIDKRISAYDASLEELDEMTRRVQENLNRIRDESAFVENAGRRVGEAQEKLNKIEKDLGGLVGRFEERNTENLERAAEAVISAVKSVVSDLETRSETITRQVETHREAVDKIERERAAGLARDMNIINKTLKEAVEKAGSRADKMEEAALVKLRDQAQERVNRLQAAWEEKLRAAQETVKARLANIQDLLRTHRDEWKAEYGDIEARQKQYRDEWKKDAQELDALAKQQRETWAALSQDTERNILETSGARLEEYKRAQAEEFKQLAGLADDVARLDGELRLSMRETVDRVNADFTRFEQESARARESSAAEFSARAAALRTEMDGVEQELNALKTKAYENVSEKLKLFEDDFFADLSKRGADIDRRLAEWHDNLGARLEELAAEGIEGRRKAELRLTEEVRKNLAGQGERLIAELERLKAETGAFEEGIREEMRAADESRQSFREQLEQDLEEARRQAEDSVRTEIGRYSLTMTENLKKSQRELEEQLRDITGQVEDKNSEITGTLESSRRSMEEWQTGHAARIRELDASMDEARRRIRDLVSESDERLVSVRTSIEDIRRELAGQTKLFDKTDELKLELERRVEDLNGDLDRLDQRRNETSQLENQFIRIKRLEDDVNAKMTRFLSEKHRVEVMETDFNRLLQTSQAVEEKLVQVSSSDDTLQAMQVQIRRLDDAIKEADEKYQRLERKNQILEETNDGIDRNFKSLQESEQAARQAGEDLARITADMESLRSSIETLAEGNEKARDAAEKLSVLDDSLSHIEKRIAEMQKAREWLARTETRLEELDKQAQNQLRLIGSLLNQGSGKPPPGGKGAPPPRDRDNIIKLSRQGWTVDEIAKSMGISKGEVELILELGLKD